MSAADDEHATEATSDGSGDGTPEGVPQCTAFSTRYGRRCRNPAILGTGFCHYHLDFTELEVDALDDTRPPYAGMHSR